VPHRGTVAHNADDIRAASMTGRFPTPWRIVEIPRGFAVADATGLQLCAFYGRADPNIAGHTGFLSWHLISQGCRNYRSGRVISGIVHVSLNPSWDFVTSGLSLDYCCLHGMICVLCQMLIPLKAIPRRLERCNNGVHQRCRFRCLSLYERRKLWGQHLTNQTNGDQRIPRRVPEKLAIAQAF